jgi:hypothetical protein
MFNYFTAFNDLKAKLSLNYFFIFIQIRELIKFKRSKNLEEVKNYR